MRHEDVHAARRRLAFITGALRRRTAHIRGVIRRPGFCPRRGLDTCPHLRRDSVFFRFRSLRSIFCALLTAIGISIFRVNCSEYAMRRPTGRTQRARDRSAHTTEEHFRADVHTDRSVRRAPFSLCLVRANGLWRSEHLWLEPHFIPSCSGVVGGRACDRWRLFVCEWCCSCTHVVHVYASNTRAYVAFESDAIRCIGLIQHTCLSITKTITCGLWLVSL